MCFIILILHYVIITYSYKLDEHITNQSVFFSPQNDGSCLINFYTSTYKNEADPSAMFANWDDKTANVNCDSENRIFYISEENLQTKENNQSIKEESDQFYVYFKKEKHICRYWLKNKTNASDFCVEVKGYTDIYNVVVQGPYIKILGVIIGMGKEEEQFKQNYIKKNLIKESNKLYFAINSNTDYTVKIKDMICVSSFDSNGKMETDFCLGMNENTNYLDYVLKTKLIFEEHYIKSDDGEQISKEITPYILYFNEYSNKSYARNLNNGVERILGYYDSNKKQEYNINLVSNVIISDYDLKIKAHLFRYSSDYETFFFIGALSTVYSNNIESSINSSKRIWIKPLAVVNGSRATQILQNYTGNLVVAEKAGLFHLIGVRAIPGNDCILSNENTQICQQIFKVTINGLTYNNVDTICPCTSLCLEADAIVSIKSLNNFRKGDINVYNLQTYSFNEDISINKDIDSNILIIESQDNNEFLYKLLKEYIGDNQTMNTRCLYKEKNIDLELISDIIRDSKSYLSKEDIFSYDIDFDDIENIRQTMFIKLSKINDSEVYMLDLMSGKNFIIYGKESIKTNHNNTGYIIYLPESFIDETTNVVHSDINIYLEYGNVNNIKQASITITADEINLLFVTKYNERLWEQSKNYDKLLIETEMQYLSLATDYKKKIFLVLIISGAFASVMIVVSIVMCLLIKKGQGNVFVATDSFEKQKEKVDIYLKKMKEFTERGALRIDKNERISFSAKRNGENSYRKSEPSGTITPVSSIKINKPMINTQLLLTKKNPIDELVKNPTSSSESDKSSNCVSPPPIKMVRPMVVSGQTGNPIVSRKIMPNLNNLPQSSQQTNNNNKVTSIKLPLAVNGNNVIKLLPKQNSSSNNVKSVIPIIQKIQPINTNNNNNNNNRVIPKKVMIVNPIMQKPALAPIVLKRKSEN